MNPTTCPPARLSRTQATTANKTARTHLSQYSQLQARNSHRLRGSLPDSRAALWDRRTTCLGRLAMKPKFTSFSTSHQLDPPYGSAMLSLLMELRPPRRGEPEREDCGGSIAV